MNKALAILGAGSWGTALAILASKSGKEILLWSRNNEIVDGINNNHINPLHFSEIKLPSNIKASNNIIDATQYEHILIVIPTQSVRQVLASLPNRAYSFIIASKGVERETLKLMSEVILELQPKSEISVLSGPNFAIEVAQGLPGATNIATGNKHTLSYLTKIFTSTNFKVHPCSDIIGVQICAAAKNVIAIACGLCLGSGFGENAKAAIFTKGIEEINQLILTLGGNRETIFSPAGIGDLTLTCGSSKSRNMAYGISLANGEIAVNDLTEGFYAAKSISELAMRHGIKLPLIEAVARAIDNPKLAAAEISKLFAQDIKSFDKQSIFK